MKKESYPNTSFIEITMAVQSIYNTFTPISYDDNVIRYPSDNPLIEVKEERNSVVVTSLPGCSKQKFTRVLDNIELEVMSGDVQIGRWVFMSTFPIKGYYI